MPSALCTQYFVRRDPSENWRNWLESVSRRGGSAVSSRTKIRAPLKRRRHGNVARGWLKDALLGGLENKGGLGFAAWGNAAALRFDYNQATFILFLMYTKPVSSCPAT